MWWLKLLIDAAQEGALSPCAGSSYGKSSTRRSSGAWPSLTGSSRITRSRRSSIRRAGSRESRRRDAADAAVETVRALGWATPDRKVGRLLLPLRSIPVEVSVVPGEGLRHRSVANFDNVHVVAKQRLLSRIGTLKPRRVDEVRRALARVAGIRPLSRAMLWFEFRKLTDDDLGAIFEFLRSVPPVRHRVNNADPPTYCPRCARRHGLGELNPP